MRMPRILAPAAALAATFCLAAQAAGITGAGATFPYPIYAKWADAYKKATGIGLNYQSIGSGGGIKQINARTVDFGASDMPLKPGTLEKDGLMQFPTVIGGAIPAVNLKGVKPGELKLTGAVLGDIYLGKVEEVERRRASRASTLASSCRTRTSRSCTAPTGRARPSSGRTTSPR